MSNWSSHCREPSVPAGSAGPGYSTPIPSGVDPRANPFGAGLLPTPSGWAPFATFPGAAFPGATLAGNPSGGSLSGGSARNNGGRRWGRANRSRGQANPAGRGVSGRGRGAPSGARRGRSGISGPTDGRRGSSGPRGRGQAIADARANYLNRRNQPRTNPAFSFQSNPQPPPGKHCCQPEAGSNASCSVTFCMLCRELHANKMQRETPGLGSCVQSIQLSGGAPKTQGVRDVSKYFSKLEFIVESPINASVSCTLLVPFWPYIECAYCDTRLEAGSACVQNLLRHWTNKHSITCSRDDTSYECRFCGKLDKELKKHKYPLFPMNKHIKTEHTKQAEDFEAM